MAARKKSYVGRHSVESAGAGAYKPKVDQDAPAKPGTGGGTKTRRRAPQHIGDGPKLTGAAKTAKDKRRLADVSDAAREYANREAYRRTDGARPSIVGRAAAGAAAGTATGAAGGGPPGAAAGAVLGGTGGALAGRKAKKAYDMAARGGSLGARRLLVAEFAVCMVVATLSPLTDKKRNEAPAAHIKRLVAIMGLFFVLGILSAAGRGASKVAAGFGGLVTVTLFISNRSLFMKVGEIFGKTDEPVDPEQNIPDPVMPPQGRDHPGMMT